MDSITVMLLAVGLAMDAFAVSVARGASLRFVHLSQALQCGLYFGLFQFLMPVLGWLLGSAFAEAITDLDHWIAFGLLAFIGGKMLWETRRADVQQAPGKARLSFVEIVLLAFATSVDALAVGIGFAVTRMPVLAAAGTIGGVAFLLSCAGVYLGSALGIRLGKSAEIVGGIVLIAIGIKILLEHLL